MKLSKFKEIANNYKSFIFDCDGVLWKGGKKISFAFEALNYLKNNNKNIFFISNNCVRSRKTIVERLKNYGFETNEKYIHLSSSLLAFHIKKDYP
jgi:4-nitrophenyl phosphatase